MKQKVKDLALEAGGSFYPAVGGELLQKFADLFLAECVQAVKDTPRHCAFTTHDLGIVECTIAKCVETLKSHFDE